MSNTGILEKRKRKSMGRTEGEKRVGNKERVKKRKPETNSYKLTPHEDKRENGWV